MMDPASSHTTREPEVERYYRFHAPLYDATRWSFLFGRSGLLDMIPDLPSQPQILEIGCGTGTNMERLEFHFPDARITGLDLSPEMLRKAGERLNHSTQIELKLGRYQGDSFDYNSFDLILLSYSLTMFGPHTDPIFNHLLEDLKPNGYIAVVDFNTSPFAWFRRWMEYNHVNFSGHLLPLLKKYFHPADITVKKAYWGLWTYFQFIGKP
ncbi:S-adenosylmethionine-diacylgycerolhomoserine-N-methlytransferase [Fodinibius roseus]|uniref:S-adenosylmethionine-diacylgycerolhomoserine-N-methlytransferase n=1 Tax=Fodinibius roseus TaxID=1194090 RepID=A0A1M4T8M6_9BACT|nr:class I SAM-dependent methyltransferase [Fodinibius roseus]SHE40770.1 S-adenosylmethionine-diacylgycerolhomoserine-N-methlytransferase [Fodinibius roseus]